MIARCVELLPPERLRELPTKRLLGRLQRLRECYESFEASDLTAEEIAAADGVVFKNDPKWTAAVADLKRELATREHVPRPAEVARAKERRRSEHREPYRHRRR